MDGQLNVSTTAAITWLVPLLGLVTILSALYWLRRRMRDKKKSRRATTSPSGVNIVEPRDRHHHHYPSPSGKLTNNSLLPTVGEMPVCLTKDVLHQERFTNNPEYDWNGDQGSTGSGADTSQLLQPGHGDVDQFKPFVIIRPEWIELKQEIGEGCFGKVFRGSLRRPAQNSLQQQDEEDEDDDEAVAVKVLKAAAGPAAQDDLLQEAEIMVSFSHPNILSLKGIVINGNIRSYPKLSHSIIKVFNDMSDFDDCITEPNIGPWLVFEYMALGDLAQLLRSANGNLFAKTKTPHCLNQVNRTRVIGYWGWVNEPCQCLKIQTAREKDFKFLKIFKKLIDKNRRICTRSRRKSQTEWPISRRSISFIVIWRVAIVWSVSDLKEEVWQ